VDECEYEKGSQNIDQLKNAEEKSLRRASSLIYISNLSIRRNK